MTDMEDRIKSIVYEEFKKVIDNIESDFSVNYVRKRYNFLLSQLDETITANMVFVSSFESKSGFAIESCAKRIARLKFGDNNVPAVVNPRNIPHDIEPDTVKGQVIVTDIDVDNGEQKPVKLLKHLIEVASNEGDVVFNPFMGVGSTGVAALELNRDFIGCEIDKQFYDAAVARIELLQGGR